MTKSKRLIAASILSIITVGCGGSIPTRATRLDDAIRASVCQAVLGADATGATLAELKIELGVTVAVSAEAGIDVGIVSATTTGSYESASTVGVTMQNSNLPSADECRQLMRERPVEVFEIDSSGRARPLTSGGVATERSSSVTNTTALTCAGEARPWSYYTRRSGAADDCLRTQPATSSGVQRRRIVNGQIRWQVISSTSEDGTECVCERGN